MKENEKKAKSPDKSSAADNEKQKQLASFKVEDQGETLTTNQGVKLSEDEFSLKAGERGPTLMEDFHFREKITHFDHERIPERIVHARGTGAHGKFELYQSMSEFTTAGFLQDPHKQTPLFLRFSTVAGSRGSADTVRDVRGIAMKFYTEEGVYDLVGNNMPVFFIQDAIKFPDFVHAVKPEPDTEVPQASSAHDTFWDFVANNQESAHMVMWVMSDRALPRSYRMMEGFGVHTFKWINGNGKVTFVKYHLKPVLGVHSLVWDETQKIAGRDPDFNRKDIYESIQKGHYPEYEFGVQMLPEEDEFKLDFDILDPTKIWPEEDVPVKIIGKITLNENVDNFFAETEQVAFHPGHLVPGIDFTNDPLLQGRLFSYTDTQLSRLGGPNFHEIPINRPITGVHNNQRDGIHRQTINKGKSSYHVNSIADNYPQTVSSAQGGFDSHHEKIEGVKIRARSASFEDHFSQAAMFYNSMSDVEKLHILEAFKFELAHVISEDIRQQIVDMFANVNLELAEALAVHIGAKPPTGQAVSYAKISPALSMEKGIFKPDSLKIGIVVAEGFDEGILDFVMNTLAEAKAMPEVIGAELTPIAGAGGKKYKPHYVFNATDSVLFDGLIILGGKKPTPLFEAKIKEFTKDTFCHYKPLMYVKSSAHLIPPGAVNQPGVMEIKSERDGSAKILEIISKHRHWGRDITV